MPNINKIAIEQVREGQDLSASKYNQDNQGLVSKTNEIIDDLNVIDHVGITSNVASLTSDLRALETSEGQQNFKILTLEANQNGLTSHSRALQTSDGQQNTKIDTLETQQNNLTRGLTALNNLLAQVRLNYTDQDTKVSNNEVKILIIKQLQTSLNNQVQLLTNRMSHQLINFDIDKSTQTITIQADSDFEQLSEWANGNITMQVDRDHPINTLSQFVVVNSHDNSNVFFQKEIVVKNAQGAVLTTGKLKRRQFIYVDYDSSTDKIILSIPTANTTAAILALTGRVSSAEEEILDLQTSVSTHVANVSSHSTDVTTLTGRVSHVEAEQTRHQQEILDLQTSSQEPIDYKAYAVHPGLNSIYIESDTIKLSPTATLQNEQKITVVMADAITYSGNQSLTRPQLSIEIRTLSGGNEFAITIYGAVYVDGVLKIVDNANFPLIHLHQYKLIYYVDQDFPTTSSSTHNVFHSFVMVDLENPIHRQLKVNTEEIIVNRQSILEFATNEVQDKSLSYIKFLQFLTLAQRKVSNKVTYVGMGPSPFHRILWTIQDNRFIFTDITNDNIIMLVPKFNIAIDILPELLKYSLVNTEDTHYALYLKIERDTYGYLKTSLEEKPIRYGTHYFGISSVRWLPNGWIKTDVLWEEPIVHIWKDGATRTYFSFSKYESYIKLWELSKPSLAGLTDIVANVVADQIDDNELDDLGALALEISSNDDNLKAICRILIASNKGQWGMLLSQSADLIITTNNAFEDQHITLTNASTYRYLFKAIGFKKIEIIFEKNHASQGDTPDWRALRSWEFESFPDTGDEVLKIKKPISNASNSSGPFFLKYNNWAQALDFNPNTYYGAEQIFDKNQLEKVYQKLKEVFLASANAGKKFALQIEDIVEPAYINKDTLSRVTSFTVRIHLQSTGDIDGHGISISEPNVVPPGYDAISHQRYMYAPLSLILFNFLELRSSVATLETGIFHYDNLKPYQVKLTRLGSPESNDSSYIRAWFGTTVKIIDEDFNEYPIV